MTAYYNEFDPFAAEWLRQLIKAGHIADGVVDERSIVDVRPEDLEGFTQCHFFAGIGGWSRALRLAGWPDSRPVWTGSPPCQPFSKAGARAGTNDPRHLAPVWLSLIGAGKPVVVFGEQVAEAINKHEWLDDLQDALEAENYATGEIVLPACSVGAPQLRQRSWMVAKRMGDPRSTGLERYGKPVLVDDPKERREKERFNSSPGVHEFWRDTDKVYCEDRAVRLIQHGTQLLVNGIPNRMGKLRGYGNAIVPEVAAEVIGAAMEIFDLELSA